MAAKNAQALFDRLLADLRQLDATTHDRILCPLCRRAFNTGAFEAPDGERKLTVEHIIHDALGGELLTLTCWQCNNKAGTTIDPHFINSIRSLNALSGSGDVLSGKLERDGVRVSVYISKTTGADGKPHWELKVPGGKPEDIRLLAESLSTGTGEFGLTFSLKYNDQKRRMSQLRVAFLVVFDSYGYRWALSEAGDAVRRILLGEAEPPDGWQHAIASIRPVRGNQDFPYEVGIWPFEFDHYRLYLVLFRIQEGTSRYFGVVLPSEEVPGSVVWPTIIEGARALTGSKLALPFQVSPSEDQ